jgi:hypothetical protein
MPAGAGGTSNVALHVADGSEILWNSTSGASLLVSVGPGAGERYGSCVQRLEPARLGQGWLPMLETGYSDAAGTHLHEESFAARDANGRLASYIHLTASSPARLRLLTRAGTTAVTSRSLYARWDGHGRAQPIDGAAYASARRSVATFWRTRLAEGASISVPEPRIEDALESVLTQDVLMTWRYSVGNAYQEFSFPESVDVSQELAEYGFEDEAKSILRTSFTRAPTPYPSWKKGERLAAAAEEVSLAGDGAFLRASNVVLERFVSELESSMRGNLLARERYSSDIPDQVYGVHAQTVVWEGLNMIARAWAEQGEAGPSRRARNLANRLAVGLRRAVRASERKLPDGSIFVPASLEGGEKPYESLTDARLGSYWNLVVPYALASGFFAPSSGDARGALRYLELHGSRLLGLVRAGAYALYGRSAAPPTSGTDEVYGINMARFLGDLDQPDELDLSLYGEVAAAMTPNTFVSGEGATVAPLDGERFRSMYLPPNSASNAAFLETLRQLLVHETRSKSDAPNGLQLAPATPRAWLEPGKRIVVRKLPTDFGPLSYSLAAGNATIRGTVDVPSRSPPAALSLRLRLPAGERIVSVSMNGRPFRRFDAASGTITLSGLSGTLALLVHVEHVPRSS